MHDPPYNASHDHPGRFTRDLMTSTGILAWQRPTPQSIHELVPRRLIQFSLRCLDRIPHTEEADRRWITIIVIGHALIRIHGSRRRKTQPILSNSPLRWDQYNKDPSQMRPRELSKRFLGPTYLLRSFFTGKTIRQVFLRAESNPCLKRRCPLIEKGTRNSERANGDLSTSLRVLLYNERK